MTLDNIITVIASLISAIVGGLIALGGVYITNKNQNNIDLENRRLSAKPWIFSLHSGQDYNYKSIERYYMELSGTFHLDKTPNIVLLVKNTDNAVFLLKKIETESNTYFPSNGNIIDKNTIIELILVLAKDGTETLKDMYLYIDDIFNNTYKYKILPSTFNSYTLHEC